MCDKVLKALEGLTAAVKEMVENQQVHAPAARARGNRTPAITSYRGGNVVQDLVDVARRAVRYARTGKKLSKKERNIARKVLKAVKANTAFGVMNTNGVDIFTHNGA